MISISYLFETSVALSVRYYSSQAYEIAFAFLKKIERLGLGYTREFIHDPKSMIQELTSRARTSKNGCSVISLGYFGGNYAVITPSSQSQLVGLLNQFDSEQYGRKGHASFKFFSGNDFFIISETGHDAIASRKNLSRFLVPSRFVKPLVMEIENNLSVDTDIKTRHTVCNIVRKVMVETMLGIKQLPSNTYDVMEAYRNDVKRWGAFPFPELLNLMPSLRKKRNEYKAFSRGILESEFEKLVQVLQTENNPGDVNLIAASVVTLFRDENPSLSEESLASALKKLSKEEIKRYFENPIVQSLPMILKAADNLTDIITLCLQQLASDPSKLKMLQDEIDQAKLFTTQELDIHALKSLPILDAFYKESLRFDAPIAVPRYTQAGYSGEAMNIPPNTMIIFDLCLLAKDEQYWNNPKEFDPTRFLLVKSKEYSKEEETSAENNRTIGQFPFVPFSVGYRNCPAFAITGLLFKLVIAKFVTDFGLQFIRKDVDDSILHITNRESSFKLSM